jgi:hypothetical protein
VGITISTDFAACACPTISIIIPAYNASATLETCLDAISSARLAGAYCIVVDDGSTDATRSIAEEFGVALLSTGGRKGPAHARNIGARASQTEILWFVDADVCVHDDAMEKLLAHFRAEPDLSAIIGAYDDEPAQRNFFSQYRNLMHPFYHYAGGEDARTFWTGCGAIRRDAFFALGGFSLAYARPSIEDIELGYRLVAAGHRIRLDAAIQGKHLKRWTFSGMVRTDVMDRAIPWTELILERRSMPNHLNVQSGQRMSVALVGAAAVLCAWEALCHAIPVLRIAPDEAVWIAIFALLATALAINLPFYRFIAVRRGWPFAFAIAPFHLLYFLYSGVGFAIGIARFLYFSATARKAASRSGTMGT